MTKIVFCTYGSSPALLHARNRLQSWGYEVAQEPSAAVTHLLLPVPSLDGGCVKGAGPLSEILPRLGADVTVFGGNLSTLPCRCVDFLQDEYYLKENAAITAQCAIVTAQQHFHKALRGAAVLIIGWGRIGKHLASLLRAAGASVTVAVRKATDLQALTDQGYSGISLTDLKPCRYALIFNTAPAPVLQEAETDPDAVLIDLASVRGIQGNRVIWARGLPGKDAPEASGALIAKTALRYALGKE